MHCFKYSTEQKVLLIESKIFYCLFPMHPSQVFSWINRFPSPNSSPFPINVNYNTWTCFTKMLNIFPITTPAALTINCSISNNRFSYLSFCAYICVKCDRFGQGMLTLTCLKLYVSCMYVCTADYRLRLIQCV